MKRHHSVRLLLVLALFALLLPLTALGKGGDNPENIDTAEVPMPQPATPLQLGETIELQSDGSRAAMPLIPSGDFIPTTVTGSEQEVGTFSILPDNPEALYPSADLRHTDSLDASDQCYTYVQNGGFEADQNWSGQGVQYVTGGYQGNRSLYMSTVNRTDAYLWQPVTLPAQAQSVFVRFTNYQNIDPGETLFVQVNNAANTQILAYQAMNSVQGSWHTLEWTLPTNQFLGQTVNLLFSLKQDGDNTHSLLWLDNVEFVACDSTTIPTDNTRTIPLVFSIHRTVSQVDREKFQEIVKYAADAIYEMSNGRHFLGDVTFYQGNQNQQNAHVLWSACVHPQTYPGGYNRPYGIGSLYSYIYMGDKFLDDCSIDAMAVANLKSSGYTLAHEMGHYFYGISDEYPVKGFPDDKRILYSVMSYQHCAAQPGIQTFCGASEHALYWLNFSHNLNFNISYPDYQKNAQFRFYGANAWDTLVRSTNLDPRSTWYNGKPLRLQYPELAAVAPRPGQWPSIELPAGSTNARSRLRFQWPVSNRQNEALYSAQVTTESGNTITYPQPALLVAQVARQGKTIARATLTAQVTAPNGALSTLVLKDDGVAPDYLPDDGRYSAILPYNQNGSYAINITFTNPANQAAFTSVGYADIAWTVNELVGESFTTTAEATFVISGYTGDDHGNQLANATTILSDNQPDRGQIDRAGDKDMFKSTLIGDGTFVLRLSSLALGIQPRLRLWQSDGTTLIGDWTIIPEEGYYYYLRLTGPMGASFYAEITHANPSAGQGMYEISFGPPLTGEVAASGYSVFLPSTIR